MQAVNHTGRKHAVLSASASKRWLNCTASIEQEQGKRETTSIYAAEGTLAHELSELMLALFFQRIDREEYDKQKKVIERHELFSKEMPAQVLKYVNYVTEEATDRDVQGGKAEVLIEARLDYSNYAEGGFGTGDIVLAGDGVLEVIDLKYGKGVEVSAEDNSQLKLYGLGALNIFDLIYDIHTVKLTVVQPRLNNFSTWSISKKDLIEWGEGEVKQAATKALAGEGELKAGEWCRWCKAAPTCRALKDRNLELLKHDFKPVNELSDEEILKVFKIKSEVENWLKLVSGYVLSQALKGKKWNGFKVVEGKSSRRWTDPDVVEETLLLEGYDLEEITNRKIKGIGDISNLLGVDLFNEHLGDLIEKPKGKPTIAKNSDKRKPYQESTALDDFSQIEEDLL